MTPVVFRVSLCLILMIVITTPVTANIYRWTTGGLIPGTEGITPGPGTNLQDWNTESHNLGLALFAYVDLTDSLFTRSDLKGAKFAAATLTNVDFTDALLDRATFDSSDISTAHLTGAIITRAHFFSNASLTKEQLYSTASYSARNLEGIRLSENDLTNWNFSEQNLTSADFLSATLLNADFSDAVVKGADFFNVTSHGFTKEQFYSTASYKTKDLGPINLENNNLSGWNFAGQNLAGLSLLSCDLSGAVLTATNLENTVGIGKLTGADLTDSVIRGARFDASHMQSPGGLTRDQLYSTASYKAKDLQGIQLDSIDLSLSNLAEQDLTGADFNHVDFTGADFTNAIVKQATFTGATNYGFTKEQLYSTASYKGNELSGIKLYSNNFTDGNFGGKNLTGASFFGSNLSNANLFGANLTNASLKNANLANADINAAIVIGADFTNSRVAGANLNGNFGKEQLYATASYQQHDLQGITFWSNDLSGWNFSGQDLTNATFSGYLLAPPGLPFTVANLTGTNFGNAIIAGASFSASTLRGFTKEQLYSTYSYQQRDLHDIALATNYMVDWDFSGQNLTSANLTSAFLMKANLASSNLTSANLFSAKLSGADLRSAVGYVPDPSARTQNTILPNGTINGLNILNDDLFFFEDSLIVRDFELGINVENSFSIAAGGVIQLILNDANWGSTFTVQPGVVPQLGGTLEIQFGATANIFALAGTVFDLFNWSSALAPTNQFAQIVLPLGTQWDVSQLYTTGEVMLLAAQAGDYDHDGDVDENDHAAWKSAFGSISNLAADGNDNGVVDAADYTVWRNNLGAGTVGSGSNVSTVPEPSSVFLAAFATFGLAAIRRLA